MDKERDETGAKTKNGPRTPEDRKSTEVIIDELKQCFEEGGASALLNCPRTSEDGISREGIINELKQCFEEEGASALLSNARQLRDDFKNKPLRIGVIGRSGSGKSSFINAFRGLREADDGAAEVGIEQATFKPTPYYHPDMAFVELWDLPGLGTPDFEKPNYLKAIEFQKYDFYIVVSCDRFTDDDLWFAKEIHEAGKRFYFVRTKLDNDVKSDKRQKYPLGSIAKVIDGLRKNCEKFLEKHGLKKTRVFIISNILEKNMGEMEALKDHLSNDEMGIKQEMLQLTMTSLSMELIQQKEEILKRWAFADALPIAAGALHSVPDVSLFADKASHYKRQFGVDDATLSRMSHLAGVSDKEFEKMLHLQSVARSTVGLTIFVATYASKITAREVKIAVPAIMLIAGGVSYCSTVYILWKMIGEYANDARKICAFAKK